MIYSIIIIINQRLSSLFDNNNNKSMTVQFTSQWHLKMFPDVSSARFRPSAHVALTNSKSVLRVWSSIPKLICTVNYEYVWSIRDVLPSPPAVSTLPTIHEVKAVINATFELPVFGRRPPQRWIAFSHFGRVRWERYNWAVSICKLKKCFLYVSKGQFTPRDSLYTILNLAYVNAKTLVQS